MENQENNQQQYSFEAVENKQVNNILLYSRYMLAQHMYVIIIIIIFYNVLLKIHRDYFFIVIKFTIIYQFIHVLLCVCTVHTYIHNIYVPHVHVHIHTMCTCTMYVCVVHVHM